jgi:osmotically-inducible protein OsmY
MKEMIARVALVTTVAALSLTACAPLVVAVVVAGTAMVVTDRRTTGAQVDDQTIQLRLANELSTAFKEKPVHIAVNSFDRRVLLTGEVPDDAVKAKAGEIAAASLNVRAVINELAIAPPSSLSERTSDTALATKVRGSFINTKEIAFNSIEIVVERQMRHPRARYRAASVAVGAHVRHRARDQGTRVVHQHEGDRLQLDRDRRRTADRVPVGIRHRARGPGGGTRCKQGFRSQAGRQGVRVRDAGGGRSPARDGGQFGASGRACGYSCCAGRDGAKAVIRNRGWQGGSSLRDRTLEARGGLSILSWQSWRGDGVSHSRAPGRCRVAVGTCRTRI